jgi:large subunit ribosomal protein L13
MKTFSATPSISSSGGTSWTPKAWSSAVSPRRFARVIRGKHKPIFTPHMDTGDNVIVINASKVKVTGRKAEQKNYFSHTGYMGHEKFTPMAP